MSNVCRPSALRCVTIVLLLACLGGCATGTDPRDPYEGFNRGVFQFNEGVDKYFLKPVAEGYRQVLPPPVRTGVSNFFSNINDVIVLVNNALQGKFTAALDDFSRILINSSIGLFGLIDVASDAGIEKHEEDFGQTLGAWGMRDGPFIMLPFLGPSNGRDVVGRVGDLFTDVLTYVDPSGVRYALWGGRFVSRRADLLDASTVFDTAALDRYQFLRDAYLQRRRNLIFDGSPPPEKDDDAPPQQPQKGAGAASVPASAASAATAGTVAAKADSAGPVRGPSVVETSAANRRPSPEQAAQTRPEPAIDVPLTMSTAAAEIDCEQQNIAPQAQTPALASTRGASSGGSTLVRLWRQVQPTSVPRQTLDGM